MKFWQYALIATAILLMSVIVIRWMPTTLVALADSEWLGVVLFGFVIGPGLLTIGIIYGVWKLGSRGEPW